VEPLEALIHRYRSLTDDLGGDALMSEVLNAPPSEAPAFDGFQTIERIVAGKVLRRDPRVPVRLTQFLGEARSMALFSDRRIVRIFEFRPEPERPVIIMEYVDGFELGHIGPSLEFAQRARVLLEVCEAVHYAHTLGVQHRDLKPSNIMVDAQLAPRILD